MFPLFRVFLLLVVAATTMGAGLPPDDEGRLNRFADAYNAYVMALKSGVRSIDKWERVEREWERLRAARRSEARLARLEETALKDGARSIDKWERLNK